MAELTLSSLAQNLIGSSAVDNQRRAKQLASQGVEIYDLGIGEPDGDSPEVVKQAAVAAINRGESHYVDPRGLEALREKIADFEWRCHGLKIDPAQIVVTVGSLGALSLAFRTLLDANDEVLILEPFWGPYANMVKLFGAKPIVIPAVEVGGALLPDFVALEKSITERTKLVILNSPNNPSGKVWSLPELQKLGALCEKHNIWIVSDEVYSELVYDPVKHLSVATLSPTIAARTIVATSVSKSFAMTGWRLGYCIAPLEVAVVIAKINHYSVRCAATVSQWAALAAFEHYEDLLGEMRARYAKRCDLVEKLFAKYPDFQFIKPEGTFYAFVKVPSYIEDVEIFVKRLLEEKGVVISAGKAYGQSSRRFIRLSFATNDLVIAGGITRIGELANQIKNKQ